MACSHSQLTPAAHLQDIRNEKVKVLRSMQRVTLDDVVLGQYRGRKDNPGCESLMTTDVVFTLPVFLSHAAQNAAA